jgi:hypothetical protein
MSVCLGEFAALPKRVDNIAISGRLGSFAVPLVFQPQAYIFAPIR